MPLKKRIREILAEQNHTYSQLAQYIGMSEDDLDFALDHNSIDIRTLELVSKALNISLYSFLRDSETGVYSPEVNKFLNPWKIREKELMRQIEDLKQEVVYLKAKLKDKE